MRTESGEDLTQEDVEYAKQVIAHQVMLQVAAKYNIMRVRMKLSYISYDKGMTIVELWLKQIVKTFRFLQLSG